MTLIAQRLAALRAEMEKCQLDAWVPPSSDPHNSEYMPLRWKVREYMSGFAASVSTMVVLKDSAYVWADALLAVGRAGIGKHRNSNCVPG